MTLLLGDCIERMRELEPDSIDAVVCDPPYSIEFMGRAWDRHENEDAAFGYYLAGLIDGEGSFRVSAKDRRCEFAMKLRDDDEWILRQAAAFIGHGRISHEPAREGSAPQAKLVVDTKEGVAALAALLLRYPLRAKKLRDFVTWAEAVDEWLTMERGNRWHGPADRARLSELGQRIRDGRAYSEVAWSGNGFQDWTRQWATEALRILKPGGHLLAFGGTRTYHRLAAGVEDAGFEIRDQIVWMFGSGFPKSLDVSKAIDARAGVAREVLGHEVSRFRADAAEINRVALNGNPGGINDDGYRQKPITEPVTAEAKRWAGWGTALKPALEPIVVARKPFKGTVAGNVLAHSTGAINVDGCRVGDTVESWPVSRSFAPGISAGYTEGLEKGPTQSAGDAPPGRWPANVILDPAAAEMLDAQTGDLAAGNHPAARNATSVFNAYPQDDLEPRPTESGGASRFFYCAKTSSAERNAGLGAFDAQPAGSIEGSPMLNSSGEYPTHRNVHPTVKPIALMRWLIRLVTPPGGTILDPFLGSGTTGCAAALEGMKFVGIEREPDYLKIAEARIRFWADHGDDALRQVAARESAERQRAELADAGQLDIFQGGR